MPDQEAIRQHIARHAAYQRVCADNALTVVFIHGIMGSPRQFDDLVTDLDPDCSVYNILLPGHGLTAKDYAASRMSQWQQHVDKLIDELADRGERILLVGHSLGGLLSIQTAVKHPDQVIGLFLLALPLKIGISRHFVRNGLTVAFDRLNRHTTTATARQTSGVYCASWTDYLRGSGRILELLVQIGRTRPMLKTWSLPLRVVLSRSDEIVSPRSAAFLPRQAGVELTWLEKSGHYVYDPAERDDLRRLFRRFVTNCRRISDDRYLVDPK